MPVANARDDGAVDDRGIDLIALAARVAIRTWVGRRIAAWVLKGAAGIGFLFGLWIIAGLGIAGYGGSGGSDAIAYWHAGRAILDGTALYGADAGTTSAYLYSPLFAQVVAPLTFLSPVSFVWLWRALELGALRVATGSWTRAGLAILVFPPVIIELAYANVNLVIAAICALAMRGLVAPWSLPVVVKAAALPLAPMAFLADRRTFLFSGAIALGAVAVSVALAPALWSDYVTFLRSAQEPTWWTNLSRGFPLAARLLVGMGLGVAAIRWPRLAPLAVLIALPIVWLSAVSILVATVAPVARRAAVEQLPGPSAEPATVQAPGPLAP